MYITNNYLCFNSVINSNKIIIKTFSEILSMKISHYSQNIIISTLIKMYRQSLLIFSNFLNLEKTFDLLDKKLRKRKIFLPPYTYSNYMLNIERLNKSNLNLSEEEENKEIKFIKIIPELLYLLKK